MDDEKKEAHGALGPREGGQKLFLPQELALADDGKKEAQGGQRQKRQKRQKLHFPPELLRECFLMLSVKAVIRQRSLSKEFNLMLKEPSFIDLHLSRSPRNRVLVVDEQLPDGKLIVASLKKVNEKLITDGTQSRRIGLPFGWNPVTSCDGVVCCVRRSLHPYKKTGITLAEIQYGWHFSFANIATRQVFSRSEFLPHMVDHLEKIYPDLMGFGCDRFNKIYKVVVLQTADVSTPPKSKVYDLGRDEWRDIEQTFPGVPVRRTRIYKGPTFIRNGVFVDGRLNWLAQDKKRTELFLVSLNLTTELYVRKELPNVPLKDIKNPNVGVLKNGLLFSYFSKTGSCFNVWRHEEGCWNMLANIPNEQLALTSEEHQESTPLLVLDLFEKDTIVLMRVRHNNDLIFYNCKEDAIVGRQNFVPKEIPWMDDAAYVESLVFPDLG